MHVYELRIAKTDVCPLVWDVDNMYTQNMVIGLSDRRMGMADLS